MLLAPDNRQRALAYAFPSNVRELENLVEVLYVFSEPGWPVPPTELPRRLWETGMMEGIVASLILAAATAAYVAQMVAQCVCVKRQAA